MTDPRLFLCNGAVLPPGDARLTGHQIMDLMVSGSSANVNIKLEDVAKVFMKHLSPRLTDLLEIAAYVYSADCATSRGKGWAKQNSVEKWSRTFQFVIGVRDLDFWQQSDIQKLLVQTLNFLSDDKYSFEFCSLQQEQEQQLYLDFSGQEDWAFSNVERVLMCSGGLDSLAGAVETAATGENLVLVSHRSAPNLSKRLQKLVAELRKTYPVQVLHIPVWINKQEDLGRESTQRTRSFLYSALGTAVAQSMQAKGVRFFENGVVSLNFPVADEVLRARASRTTHPRVIDLFKELYSLVLQRAFEVDNPYLFKTKAEVVSVIAQNGGSHLIPHSCSCAHERFKPRTQWHCGTCSQCIDRRIAMFATGQQENDFEIDYEVDVFTGPRKEGYEKNMAVDYVRHALELNLMSDDEMVARFSTELSRAVRGIPKSREVAQQIVDMHKRHGETVQRVLQEQLRLYIDKLMNGKLEPTSMLRMVFGQEHLESSWRRYAERIISLLQAGVPTACQTHKPKDEPHLQEICDGILVGHDGDLMREFPFMSWSSSLTKPDWSVESMHLWVELKYVRQKSDKRPITRDIAEDITKYGDNNRRVLFVVYDPDHLITNEAQFSKDICKHSEMLVHFIR